MTHCRIPEDLTPQIHCCESLRSHKHSTYTWSTQVSYNQLKSVRRDQQWDRLWCTWRPEQELPEVVTERELKTAERTGKDGKDWHSVVSLLSYTEHAIGTTTIPKHTAELRAEHFITIQYCQVKEKNFLWCWYSLCSNTHQKHIWRWFLKIPILILFPRGREWFSWSQDSWRLTIEAFVAEHNISCFCCNQSGQLLFTLIFFHLFLCHTYMSFLPCVNFWMQFQYTVIF